MIIKDLIITKAIIITTDRSCRETAKDTKFAAGGKTLPTDDDSRKHLA